MSKYYMTADINGCVSLKLNAVNLRDAIDEGCDRVGECYEGKTDLEDKLNLCLDGVEYNDACEQLTAAGAVCQYKAEISGGVSVWEI